MIVRILGVRFDALTLEQAAEQVQALTKCPLCSYVCTPNPEIVLLSQKQPALWEALEHADLTLPDGVGIVWASQVLGTPVPERVTGCDLMMRLLDTFHGSIYLLGGKPGVGEKAARRVMREHPAVSVAGFQDGYFQDPAPVWEALTELHPDLILTGLGSPRQELFMEQARAHLSSGVLIGVGGSLDILAGVVPRAPESWQRHKVEWLYRLLHQPWRLGRQMKLPFFVLKVLRLKRTNQRRAEP